MVKNDRKIKLKANQPIKGVPVNNKKPDKNKMPEDIPKRKSGAKKNGIDENEPDLDATDKENNETIMFFCAHNDDNIVGAGGTIAKYSKEGKDVITIIFSYGEMSHPHLKEKIVINTRVKESKKAQNILGEKEVIYLGLKEGAFEDGIRQMKAIDVIGKLISDNNPSKIFMHSMDDVHPDHKAVYSIVSEVIDNVGFTGEVYSYDVWTIVNYRKRDCPKLVVDISKTFKKKIKAFKMHRSQMNAQILLMWSIYLKAWVHGLNNGVKYAEVFYKLK